MSAILFALLALVALTVTAGALVAEALAAVVAAGAVL